MPFDVLMLMNKIFRREEEMAPNKVGFDVAKVKEVWDEYATYENQAIFRHMYDVSGIGIDANNLKHGRVTREEMIELAGRDNFASDLHESYEKLGKARELVAKMIRAIGEEPQ